MRHLRNVDCARKVFTTAKDDVLSDKCANKNSFEAKMQLRWR